MMCLSSLFRLHNLKCMGIGLFLILFSSTLTANPTRPEFFSFHDRNFDGFISRSEYTVMLSQMRNQSAKRMMKRGQLLPLPEFDAVDINGDAKINEKELVDMLQIRRQKRKHLHSRKKNKLQRRD